MKRYILIVVLIALISNAFTSKSFVNEVLDKMSNKPQKEIFQAFHSLHEKTYKLNSEEGLNRYRIFKKNVAWIKEENAKLGKVVYGITQFSDLTHEEFVEKHLMKPEVFQKGMEKIFNRPLRFLAEKEVHYHQHVHYHHQENTNEKNGGDDNHNLTVGDIDHRKYDNVIKNQGGCGSCWAFAAIGAIENNYRQLMGSMTTFSEQYLVDCDNRDSGCDGGWPSNTFEWIANNGIVEDRFAPYEGSQGDCKTKLDKLQYHVVKGAEMFSSENQPQTEWDNLLAKGPIVVGMDASFDGFGMYRPNTFEPLRPRYCSNPNHAVVAVGKVTENGEEFLIVRNSWGKSWGYGGYFKITRSKNCHITDLGWLPQVYKGKVPDPNDKPEPEPASDCVKLYGRGGFRRHPMMEACDSLTTVQPNGYFFGIKLPENTTTGKPIRVMVFPWDNCDGTWAMPIEESTEYVRRNGRDAYPASMAFVKEAKPGCVNFYTETCHKGKPEFMICNDIKDTQLVNFSALPKVLSILPDTLSIKRITFFTEPNFEGKGTTIEGKAYYNLVLEWKFREAVSKTVRSVRIEKN